MSFHVSCSEALLLLTTAEVSSLMHQINQHQPTDFISVRGEQAEGYPLLVRAVITTEYVKSEWHCETILEWLKS